MSWYKKAKSPILQFISHNSYGELKVFINNKLYIYYDVSPFAADQLKKMISNPRIPGGTIIQRLKNFSSTKRYEESVTPQKEIPKERGLFDELV